MDLGLSGKRALITGATRGIGRAIAHTLVTEGAAVAICGRNRADLDRAVDQIGRDGTVIGSVVDAMDRDALVAWVDSSARDLGGIDIYVHGVSAKADEGDDAWNDGYAVDVMALVAGVGAAADHLAAGDGGVVITLGTVAMAEHFLVGATSYTAMKAAAINWTLGQAQLLGQRGVRCNVVSPGPTLVEGGSWDQVRTEAPLLYAATEQRHPCGRLATAQDIANVVVFVASEAARHLNGAHITVDGGFLKRVDY